MSRFDCVRPDEVAECWDGVPAELSTKLWSFVPEYKKIDYEECGPHDVIGINSVAQFWDRLTEEEQKTLERLAAEEDARWDSEVLRDHAEDLRGDYF